MAGDVKAAQELVASMGGMFDRSVVVRWGALKDKATGRERQLIQWMSEAFHPMTRTEEDRRWLAAFLSGMPMDDAQASARADAEDEDDQPAAADDGIDWAKVAREAQTMVDLNRSANEAWHAGKQKGKQKPQDD